MRRLAKKNDEKDGSALHEASVLSSYADGAGRTAIHFAANFGVLPCCEYIVETAPEYVLFVSLRARAAALALTGVAGVCGGVQLRELDGPGRLYRPHHGSTRRPREGGQVPDRFRFAGQRDAANW